MEGKNNGKVLWYNPVRGYGFIGVENGEDVFVHQSALSDTQVLPLQPGQNVEFRLEPGPKGLQAVDVIRLN